jgi:hypothetical protein
MNSMMDPIGRAIEVVAEGDHYEYLARITKK